MLLNTAQAPFLLTNTLTTHTKHFGHIICGNSRMYQITSDTLQMIMNLLHANKLGHIAYTVPHKISMSLLRNCIAGRKTVPLFQAQKKHLLQIDGMQDTMYILQAVT